MLWTCLRLYTKSRGTGAVTGSGTLSQVKMVCRIADKSASSPVISLWWNLLLKLAQNGLRLCASKADEKCNLLLQSALATLSRIASVGDEISSTIIVLFSVGSLASRTSSSRLTSAPTPIYGGRTLIVSETCSNGLGPTCTTGSGILRITKSAHLIIWTTLPACCC